MTCLARFSNNVAALAALAALHHRERSDFAGESQRAKHWCCVICVIGDIAIETDPRAGSRRETTLGAAALAARAALAAPSKIAVGSNTRDGAGQEPLAAGAAGAAFCDLPRPAYSRFKLATPSLSVLFKLRSCRARFNPI